MTESPNYNTLLKPKHVYYMGIAYPLYEPNLGSSP